MPSSYTTNYSWILPEIGSDTDAWGAHLNYNFGDVTNGLDTVVKNISNVANAALPKAGGTVTGAVTFSGGSATLTMGAPIILSGNPTSSNHASNKAYVDAGDNTNATAAANAQATANAALARSGGTMTGFITLHADPTVNAHAVTKSYADTKLALSGGTMTGTIAFSAGQPTATTSSPNIVQLTNSTSSTSTTTAATPAAVKSAFDLASAALARSGGTMTGKITLDGDPAADLHAVPRQYVTAYAQPIDADLTAIAALSGTGLARRTGTNTWALDTNIYLTGNQTISLSGDATGSGATSIPVTLANTGIAAGTYTKLTVDAKGRATSGTTLSAADIPTITSGKISDFDAQVRTSRLNEMSVPVASVSFNGQRITSLADPSASSDAATRNYVDTTRLSVTGGTLSGNLAIQNGSDERQIYLGGSGGYFYGNNSEVGWFKSGGGHVRWGQGSGNFLTNGSITAASSISGSSLSATNGSVTASTSITAGTSISAASGSITNALSIGSQSSADHATRKDYVDSLIATRLPLTGGTMTGNFIISNTSPTIQLNDTDQSGAALHCNSNLVGFTNYAVNDWLFNVDTAGNATAKSNVTAYSDERLKTDIRTIDDALHIVRNLRGVRYRRKDTVASCVGVIAQEVREWVPEVVHENDDGILSVAYGNLVGVLIEAVKELSDRLEAIEAR